MPPRHITFAIAALLVAGCSMPALPTLSMLTPYKMDVQQGNVVTQEMIAKVRPGMTRNQVRFALGTPLVVDPFRTDRWDYVYHYQKAGVLTEHRRIAVIFKDDKLVRIEGDVVPAGAETKEGAAKMGKSAPPAAKPVAAASATARTEDTAPEPAAGVDNQKEEKVKEEKPMEQKPQEERGFFGRMLDRLGF